MTTTNRHILFIQGGGEGAYAADAKLVASLQTALGPSYKVNYPQMPNEADPDYKPWRPYIAKEIETLGDGVIIVGHSLGGSILLKYLTENPIKSRIDGIFLISTPFWGIDENWQYEDFTLKQNFADALPKGAPIFIYQSHEDEIVESKHADEYAQKLPDAVIRYVSGGHQLGDDLTQIAADIEALR